MMSLARLLVVFTLGLSSMTLAQAAPVQAADPNWVQVGVGISDTSSDSEYVVSADGTYCKYPMNFPIKAGSNVTLMAAHSAEPLVDSLNSLMAESYGEEERSPGDVCAIWAEFNQVPMSTQYVIKISAAETTGSTYTGDVMIALVFWTSEFERSIAPDGGPACEARAATAMRPGGSFQSEPAGESLRDTPIVGEVLGASCRLSLILSVPPSSEITVGIPNLSAAHSTIPETLTVAELQTSEDQSGLSAETLEYCANSPLYPVGTILHTNSLGWLQDSTGFMVVPVGTQLKITGPVIDRGTCDDWPVEVTSAASAGSTCDAGSMEFDEICTVDGGERGHIMETVFRAVPSVNAPPAQGNCDPSYPDVCIPPSPPDLDCSDVPFGNFRVAGADPHQFDGPYDGSNPYEPDGLGCEWN